MPVACLFKQALLLVISELKVTWKILYVIDLRTSGVERVYLYVQPS